MKTFPFFTPRHSRRRLSALFLEQRVIEVLEARQLLSAAPARPEIQEPGVDPVSLSWDDGQSAGTFELWVNNLTTGESATIHVFGITSSTFSLQDHQDPGIYRAWVRGSNTFGNSPWSSPVNYAIDVESAPPETPQVLSPTTATSRQLVTFTWTDTARSDSYEIWVNNLTNGTSRVIHEQNLTTTSFTADEPLSVGSHRVWVRAFNAAGASQWSRGNNFTVLGSLTPPARPVISDPGSSPQSVQWTPNAAADSYEIWINNLTTGENAVVRETGIVETEFVLSETLKTGTHRVWVRAFNAAGASQWSLPVEFTVTASSDGPSIAPSITDVSQTDAAGHVTIRWEDELVSDSFATARKFEVWISDLTSGERFLHERGVTQTSLTPNDALPEGRYAVWVRASNQHGLSEWSDRFEFETGRSQPPASTMAEVTGGVLTVRMANNGTVGGSLVIGSTAGRVYVGTSVNRNAYIRPNEGVRSLDIREIRVIGSNQSDRINLVGVKRGPGAQPGHFDNLQKVVLLGGGGNDTIHGSAFDDHIYGEDGNDVVYGLKGNDLIYGGNDHDSLYGGADQDAIHAGSGDDTVGGTDTNHKDQVLDRLFGDEGDDWIVGFSSLDVHSGIEHL